MSPWFQALYCMEVVIMMTVWPGGYYPPCHQTHYDLHVLIKMASYDVANKARQILPAASSNTPEPSFLS